MPGPPNTAVALSAALAPYAPLPYVVHGKDGFGLVEHRGDPPLTLVGPSLRAVDPAQVRLPVELREPVEERAGNRIGVQRSSYVVG